MRQQGQSTMISTKTLSTQAGDSRIRTSTGSVTLTGALSCWCCVWRSVAQAGSSCGMCRVATGQESMYKNTNMREGTNATEYTPDAPVSLTNLHIRTTACFFSNGATSLQLLTCYCSCVYQLLYEASIQLFSFSNAQLPYKPYSKKSNGPSIFSSHGGR